MVIAHHLVLTGYGHWLSNDPRGSRSLKTWCPDLAGLAEKHFGRKKVQPSVEELRAFYRRAQKRLAMPTLWWDGAERHELVRAFGEVIERERLTCYACAVLRNHAHLLVRKHRLKAEEMIGILKDTGRRRLREKRMAGVDHPVFSADSCHVFKSTPQLVRNCVQYINDNYRKHNIPCVACDFVVPYDDWPFHKKMSPPPGI